MSKTQDGTLLLTLLLVTIIVITHVMVMIRSLWCHQGRKAVSRKP